HGAVYRLRLVAATDMAGAAEHGRPTAGDASEASERKEGARGGTMGFPHGLRRGWDSNPRGACTPNGFQDRPVRPLRHPAALSVARTWFENGRYPYGRGARGRFSVEVGCWRARPGIAGVAGGTVGDCRSSTDRNPR